MTACLIKQPLPLPLFIQGGDPLGTQEDRERVSGHQEQCRGAPRAGQCKHRTKAWGSGLHLSWQVGLRQVGLDRLIQKGSSLTDNLQGHFYLIKEPMRCFLFFPHVFTFPQLEDKLSKNRNSCIHSTRRY